MTSNPFRLTIYYLVGFAIAIWLILDVPNESVALCATPENPELLGLWKNEEAQDKESQEIKEVQIEYLCEEAIQCDEVSGRCSPLRVGYFIDIRSSESLSLWEWGQQKADFVADQNTLKATYEEGGRKTFVKISLIQRGKRQGQLLLHWLNRNINQPDSAATTGVEFLTKRNSQQ